MRTKFKIGSYLKGERPRDNGTTAHNVVANNSVTEFVANESSFDQSYLDEEAEDDPVMAEAVLGEPDDQMAHHDPQMLMVNIKQETEWRQLSSEHQLSF